MRILKYIFVFLFAFFSLENGAKATVRIHIDLSSQRMHVKSSRGSYVWPVSTARSGYYTPRGSFAPRGLQRMHYSSKYEMSPMPYSIFFRGGYANFMAHTPSARLAAPSRMAACVCPQLMRRDCSTWSNPRARVSRSAERLPDRFARDFRFRLNRTHSKGAGVAA